jgi:hypothetical protein
MDVLGFLYVSLGSSTVQLHERLDGHCLGLLFCIYDIFSRIKKSKLQTRMRLFKGSIHKMATVLEVCTTEELLSHSGRTKRQLLHDGVEFRICNVGSMLAFV